jgi:hypothetical protein
MPDSNLFCSAAECPETGHSTTTASTLQQPQEPQMQLTVPSDLRYFHVQCNGAPYFLRILRCSIAHCQCLTQIPFVVRLDAQKLTIAPPQQAHSHGHRNLRCRPLRLRIYGTFTYNATAYCAFCVCFDMLSHIVHT